MNLIFCSVTILSLVILLIFNPNAVLVALNNGTMQALELSVKLFCIYSVWLGVFELIKSGGISRLTSKILKKPIKFLFGETSQKSLDLITLNLSSNLLGLSSVATPIGIQAQSLLEKEANPYAQTMLFVIACAPLQLVPTSVISLRASLGSLSPASVYLPILLCTLVCFTTSVLLVKVFIKR